MITAIKLWSRVLFKIFQIGSIFPSSQWQPGHICVEITKQPCTSNCVERNTKYSKNILRNHSFFHAFQCKICLHDALLVYQKKRLLRCSSISQRLFISVVCFGCISKGRGEISCRMLTRSSFSQVQPNSSLTATLLSTMSFWQVALRVKHRPIRQTLPQFTVLAALHV